ncbi:hypothetical protein [Fulvivirga lutea]|uniref:Aromatic hydrocarbon degradation protein n=1 Tax=Fulvivirga lutea TaxID=2810512 RepID=A0A975A1K4_9BACT|nr:hypothetical protein [Fulvivirga lutea]QSE97617.1 hypothetical protein JR347_00580 [Fulvivirga lutea]
MSQFQKRFRRILFCLSLTIPIATNGQVSYNINALPMGDVEALLANTGTGGVESPGAVFYNPAALVMLKGSSFSLNGSAYMKFENKAEPVLVIADQELNYKADGFLTIPTSIAVVKQVSKWKLAFSALVPYEANYEGPKQWTVPFETLNVNLRILQNYKERLFYAGLSAAREIGNDWSLGTSVYWQSYSLLNVNDVAITVAENPALLDQSTERQDVNVHNLALIMGLQKRYANGSIGLKVDLPSIQLSSNAEVFSYKFSNLNGPSTGSRENQVEVDAEYNQPFSVRFGAVKNLMNNKLLITSDISYSLNNSYRLVDLPFDDLKIDTKNSVRHSFGTQLVLSEKITLLSGFANAWAEVDEIDRHFWSATIATKLQSEHITSSIGFFYSQENAETPLDSGIGITKNKSTLMGLFLGTSYRF